MKPFLQHIAAVMALVLLAIPMPAQTKGGMSVKTVVIDPGHGGHDAGCVSKDKKTYEKNVALDISKRLAQKISAAYPEVSVKMTRSDDRFIELKNRGIFANNAGGDLFISIHVNATDKGTGPHGYSIHCLGHSSNPNRDIFQENLNLVKKENAVVKFEDDYKTSYQGYDPDDPESSILFALMQNAHLTNSLAFAADLDKSMGNGPVKHSRGISQDPFLVLARAAMPAVLIETGFITNPTDLASLRSEVGREGIADSIFKAFCAYKTRMDGQQPQLPSEPQLPSGPQSVQPEPEVSTPEPEPQPEPQPQPEAQPSDSGVLYGVQVLVSSREIDSADSFFQGYKPMVVKAGKWYKYVINTSISQKEVKKAFSAIQKKFPDSYLVKIENGIIAPLH